MLVTVKCRDPSKALRTVSDVAECMKEYYADRADNYDPMVISIAVSMEAI